MRRRLRITRSFSSEPAGAVSARLTAARTAAIAPSRGGATARRWRGTTSMSGRANEAVTVSNASDAVRSPTSTPEMVTPVAIVCGVVVVVRRAGRRGCDHAGGEPAGGGEPEHEQERETHFPHRARSLAPEDARIVRDHAVDSKAHPAGPARRDRRPSTRERARRGRDTARRPARRPRTSAATAAVACEEASSPAIRRGSARRMAWRSPLTTGSSARRCASPVRSCG